VTPEGGSHAPCAVFPGAVRVISHLPQLAVAEPQKFIAGSSLTDDKKVMSFVRFHYNSQAAIGL